MAISSPIEPNIPSIKNGVDERSIHDNVVNEILKIIIQIERFAKQGFQRVYMGMEKNKCELEAQSKNA